MTRITIEVSVEDVQEEIEATYGQNTVLSRLADDSVAAALDEVCGDYTGNTDATRELREQIVGDTMRALVRRYAPYDSR